MYTASPEKRGERLEERTGGRRKEKGWRKGGRKERIADLIIHQFNSKCKSLPNFSRSLEKSDENSLTKQQFLSLTNLLSPWKWNSNSINKFIVVFRLVLR